MGIVTLSIVIGWAMAAKWGQGWPRRIAYGMAGAAGTYFLSHLLAGMVWEVLFLLPGILPDWLFGTWYGLRNITQITSGLVIAAVVWYGLGSWLGRLDRDKGRLTSLRE